MITQGFFSKRKQGFMALAFIGVLILTVVISVGLHLFLKKNAVANENDFNSNFETDNMNPLTETKGKLDAEIKGLPASFDPKNKELNDAGLKEKELKESLDKANKDAEERKKDQKIISVNTPADKLPADPVFEKKEIKEMVKSINDKSSIISSAISGGFDEKTMKGKAVRLNEELKTFIAKKEMEASSNFDSKKNYGRDWVLIANDLKKEGKSAVVDGTKIKTISDLPKTKDGVEILMKLLLQKKAESLNYFFAFEYFPHHKDKLVGFIKNLKIDMVAMPDKDPKKNMETLKNKQGEFENYVAEYKAFLEKLNRDNK